MACRYRHIQQKENQPYPKARRFFNIRHQCLDNDEFKSNHSYVMVCVYLLIVAILVNIYSSVEAIFIIYGSKNHSTCKENYEDTLVLITLFAFLQLILSGDIESNPGPIVYKNCPVCNKMVHLRSKTCSSCEYNKKQVKGISNSRNSSIRSGVNGVSYRSTNIPVTTSPNVAKITQWKVRESNSSQKWAKRNEQTNAKRCLLYKQNSERKRNISRKNYHKHASSIKNHVLNAYYSKHDLNKAKQRQMYKQNKGKILDKRRIAALISCSISKKYSKFRSGPSKLTAYIKKILAKVQKNLWMRSTYISNTWLKHVYNIVSLLKMILLKKLPICVHLCWQH